MLTVDVNTHLRLDLAITEDLRSYRKMWMSRIDCFRKKVSSKIHRVWQNRHHIFIAMCIGMRRNWGQLEGNREFRDRWRVTGAQTNGSEGGSSTYMSWPTCAIAHLRNPLNWNCLPLGESEGVQQFLSPMRQNSPNFLWGGHSCRPAASIERL